jgi:hypothetical protein
MIDEAELRRRLLPILEAEERGDWDEVEQLSDRLNRDLAEQKFQKSVEIVDHYLDDADVREKDHRYGETQRRQVRRFVDTGEHEEGTNVPPWSCALIAIAIIAVLIWLLS